MLSANSQETRELPCALSVEKWTGTPDSIVTRRPSFFLQNPAAEIANQLVCLARLICSFLSSTIR